MFADLQPSITLTFSSLRLVPSDTVSLVRRQINGSPFYSHHHLARFDLEMLLFNLLGSVASMSFKFKLFFIIKFVSRESQIEFFVVVNSKRHSKLHSVQLERGA